MLKRVLMSVRFHGHGMAGIASVCALLLLPACASVPMNNADMTAQPGKSAIASAHPLATQAGMDIIAAGGNAFDAAVAVTSALAVVEPYSSGIGGGGFWLLHRAEDGFQTMVDGRETMPMAGHRDMYLDEQGNVIPGASMNGPLSAGIPGVPAAMVHMAQKYGQLPLAQSLAPAIRLANEGFEVDEHYARMAGFRLKAIQASVDAARLFLKDNAVPPVGHVIKQPELAATIRLIAEQGFDGFYKGELAEKLVKGVVDAGGIWTLDDMAAYRIKERTPVTTTYGDMKIVSAPPPSSGGIAIATILNILEGYDLAAPTVIGRFISVIPILSMCHRRV
jgi:gamma-glutamyltranspeptidase/glutathione hydrolase